jgi:DNA-binding response OmpR family regulator
MKRKVLVVDDSPAITRMLGELLEGAGYDVVTADTYEQGKKLADTVDPDLLIIDIRLGDYNGLQLALRQRISHPDRPVIVMSGYVDPVLEAETRRQGATFIEKPIQPTHLVTIIRGLLDGDES